MSLEEMSSKGRCTFIVVNFFLAGSLPVQAESEGWNTLQMITARHSWNTILTSLAYFPYKGKQVL
jgi:hypothetical protein